jgi:hypothetical protein
MDREDAEARRLTLEHVPPQAVGGSEVVLTCERCNSRHGGWFDGQAAIEERQIRALQADHPLDVMVEVDGHHGRFSLWTPPGTFGLAGVPEASSSASLDAIGEALRARAQQGRGWEFAIRPWPSASPERVQLSWIRAAYLACFASFGWLWIFNEVLDPIRARLETRDGNPLPALTVVAEDAEPRRQLMQVEKPTEIAGLVVVQWDLRFVLLPGLGATAPLSEIPERLEVRDGQPFHFDFRGDVLPWPTEAVYLADRVR